MKRIWRVSLIVVVTMILAAISLQIATITAIGMALVLLPHVNKLITIVIVAMLLFAFVVFVSALGIIDLIKKMKEYLLKSQD